MQYKILKKSVKENIMTVLCELDGHKFNETPKRLDSRRILNDLELDNQESVVILLVELKTVYSKQDSQTLCTFTVHLKGPEVELNKAEEDDGEQDRESRGGRGKRTKDKLQPVK
jgi:hypothetical protein